MLEQDLLDDIAALVRSGFYDKEELLEIVCDEMHAPGELDPDAVADAIDAAMEDLEDAKLTWPEVTDCDRLALAFAALGDHGVIALENAGYTQSDGYEDFRDAYEAHASKEGVVGYCFYHGQDLARAVRGEGLMLAFGPVDPSEEATKGHDVGVLVRTELERAGLRVVWDGTHTQRIHVPDFVWRRR
jgi:hypothetical protein